MEINYDESFKTDGRWTLLFEDRPRDWVVGTLTYDANGERRPVLTLPWIENKTLQDSVDLYKRNRVPAVFGDTSEGGFLLQNCIIFRQSTTRGLGRRLSLVCYYLLRTTPPYPFEKRGFPTSLLGWDHRFVEADAEYKHMVQWEKRAGPPLPKKKKMDREKISKTLTRVRADKSSWWSDPDMVGSYKVRSLIRFSFAGEGETLGGILDQVRFFQSLFQFALLPFRHPYCVSLQVRDDNDNKYEVWYRHFVPQKGTDDEDPFFTRQPRPFGSFIPFDDLDKIAACFEKYKSKEAVINLFMDLSRPSYDEVLDLRVMYPRAFTTIELLCKRLGYGTQEKLKSDAQKKKGNMIKYLVEGLHPKLWEALMPKGYETTDAFAKAVADNRNHLVHGDLSKILENKKTLELVNAMYTLLACRVQKELFGYSYQEIADKRGLYGRYPYPSEGTL